MTHVQGQVRRHRHPVSHHPQTRIYNPRETNGRKATRNCQNDSSCDWRGPRSAPRFTHLREVTQVSSMPAKLPIWSGMTNMGARGGRLSCTCVLPLAARSPQKVLISAVCLSLLLDCATGRVSHSPDHAARSANVRGHWREGGRFAGLCQTSQTGRCNAPDQSKCRVPAP